MFGACRNLISRRPTLLGVLAGTLVLAAPAWAADVLPPAVPNPFRGNGETVGFYLSLWKLIVTMLLFWLWVATAHWVDRDGRELGELNHGWNLLMLAAGLIGMGAFLVLPMPGTGGFLVRMLLFAGVYGGAAASYVATRNRRVSETDKVLTSDHILGALERLFARFGLRLRKASAQVRVGPPIDFVGKSLTHQTEDPSRVRVAAQSTGYLSVKELVYDAVTHRATDIHLEPREDVLNVRYRIDGLLHEAEPFDRVTGDAILNIFKVLAGVDIAEKRKPQDGSFGANSEGREIDFRVATQGTMSGEKISLRILDKGNTVQRLTDLGMREKMRAQISQLATLPNGLFICCGPTGAGKSTTLYACLREIDRFTKNVITIEDPIEYRIEGVVQIEINTKAGQNFGQSLRSILRQDPDVIMIGEIRDQETAKIACQAATTGHMVFTTIHANDTITALFRLLDLGVEPFIVSGSLTAILGQRLVRRLCPNCKVPYRPKPEVLRKANLPAERIDVFYRPPDPDPKLEQVCPQCGGAGYFGRTGIFELLVVNDQLRDLIRENPSLSAIRNEARKAGMLYLQEDGFRQVIKGVTSIKELTRVV